MSAGIYELFLYISINFIGILLLYSVVLASTVSKVNQLCVYLYPLCFGFLSHSRPTIDNSSYLKQLMGGLKKVPCPLSALPSPLGAHRTVLDPD